MNRRILITTLLLLWAPERSEAFPGMVAGALSLAGEQEDRSESPVEEAVIERYIMDPRGEVEGLILTGGVYLYVTSRAEAQLTHALKPGDLVRVLGRHTAHDGLVQPDVIKNLTRGTTFVVPLRLDLPMQEQEHRLSVTEMYATGTIRLLLYHALEGTVQGMVLSDETQIRLPLDAGADLRQSLHVGDTVAIKGNGTKNRFGRAIEAVAMGRDLRSLVTLDASLRSLP